MILFLLIFLTEREGDEEYFFSSFLTGRRRKFDENKEPPLREGEEEYLFGFFLLFLTGRRRKFQIFLENLPHQGRRKKYSQIILLFSNKEFIK